MKEAKGRLLKGGAADVVCGGGFPVIGYLCVVHNAVQYKYTYTQK